MSTDWPLRSWSCLPHAPRQRALCADQHVFFLPPPPNNLTYPKSSMSPFRKTATMSDRDEEEVCVCV